MSAKAWREVLTHQEGPGLKILSSRLNTWYGGGYCGRCGDQDNLIPQAVRFWDPDDGWRSGVLCLLCGEAVALRGPRPGDYAAQARK